MSFTLALPVRVVAVIDGAERYRATLIRGWEASFFEEPSSPGFYELAFLNKDGRLVEVNGDTVQRYLSLDQLDSEITRVLHVLMGWGRV